MEGIVSTLGRSLPIVLVLSLALVLVIRRRGGNDRAGAPGTFLTLVALAAPFEGSYQNMDAWIVFVIGLAGLTTLAWNLDRSKRS